MRISKKYQVMLAIVLTTVVVVSFAEGGGKDIGGIADKVATTLGSIGKVMVAISYVAGFGFLVFGILKFKQHKDNPQQVTLGTPIVMTLIGAVLVFIGGFIAPLGETFGVKPTSEEMPEVPGAGKPK